MSTESPLPLPLPQVPQDPQILIQELKLFPNNVIEIFLVTAAQDIEIVSPIFNSAYTQEQFPEFE